MITLNSLSEDIAFSLGEQFNETLQESISNNPLEICKKQCSTRIRAANQFQLRREVAFE